MLSGSKAVIFCQVCCNIWPKIWLLVKKNFWENFFVKVCFRLFQDKKKVPMATKLDQEGVKTLVAGPLKNIFLRLP